MKIVVIMPLGEQRGGGELMLSDLMEHGQDLGIEWVVVFLQDGPMVAQVRGLGVEACLLPAGRLREPHHFLATIVKLARFARARNADAILSWMGQTHFYGGLSALAAGIPAIWYQLGVPADKIWIDRLATMIPARAILTLSIAGQQAQERLWPRRNTPLVYPGVALNRYDPASLPSKAEARRNLALPATGPLIGIVGRLQRWKGMHVFIEAMPSVLERFPAARGVIVGGSHDTEPDYGASLERRIRELGLEQCVRLVGLQRNVPEWMQAMDVVVHASDHEPFGIVVIEAMALGKPVVAGSAAGPAEIITDGRNGLLTPYGDAGALATAIIKYLDDAAMAERMGIAARQRALEFSTKQYAINCVNALNQILRSAA